MEFLSLDKIEWFKPTSIITCLLFTCKCFHM